MDPVVLGVFAFVYLGMMVGRIPGLALDRTGVALLGAIVLVASGRISADEAWRSVDVPTIGLLLGLMVVSAQFRLGGAYAAVTRRLAGMDVLPAILLALIIAMTAILSAILANDIVCLAAAPLLVEGCARRGLKPKPFLLALACASNVGSAATLIGNPQNMLIGQSLRLSFSGYLLDGGVPAVLGCVVIWLVVCLRTRGDWHNAAHELHIDAPTFNPWQTTKGTVVTLGLMVVFLFTAWPREVAALAAAGVVLMSRRMHTRRMLALVDWQLLVLFFGLFVVNEALAASGVLARSLDLLNAAGVDVADPPWLFGFTVVLSNLVSNVPAVMLLLPTATHPMGGAILAVASTLAGNLLLVGSIANIIVVDQAARLSVRISWKDHARVGVPVTMGTLLIAAGWLWIRSAGG